MQYISRIYVLVEEHKLSIYAFIGSVSRDDFDKHRKGELMRFYNTIIFEYPVTVPNFTSRLRALSLSLSLSDAVLNIHLDEISDMYIILMHHT